MDTTINTAKVSQFARIFFHVGALDLNTPFGAIIQHHVQVAVVRDRLVILRDLVIFRLIRVEVILPGKPRRFCNLTIQRQANFDRPFDSLLVHDGESAR